MNRTGTVRDLGATAALLGIGVLLALGAALRWWGVAAESLWLDEVLTVERLGGGMGEVARRVAGDAHPFLYYMGLNAWTAFAGMDEAGLRAYSLLWGLLGMAAMAWLAWSIAGRRAALLAVLVAAAHPMLVYYAQEARNYTQATTFVALSTGFLWKWMDRAETAARRRMWLAGYSILGAALLLTHYLGAFILAGQGIVALLWLARGRRWPECIGYLLSSLFVAIVFLPWGVFVWVVNRNQDITSQVGWVPKPPVVEYFAPLGREYAWGMVSLVHDVFWIPTLVAAIAVSGLAATVIARDPCLSARARHGALFLGLVTVAPVALVALTDSLKPLFIRPRFAMLVSPSLFVLAGMALASVRMPGRSIITGATVLFLLAGTAIQRYTPQKDDWRGFAATWRSTGPPDIAVFMPHYIAVPAAHAVGESLPTMGGDKLQAILPHLGGRTIWIVRDRGDASSLAPPDHGLRGAILASGRTTETIVPPFLLVESVTVSDAASTGTISDILLNRGGRISGIGPETGWHEIEVEPAGAFRWAKGEATFTLGSTGGATTLSLEAWAPPAMAGDGSLALSITASRAGGGEASVTLPDPWVESRRIEVPLPPGDDPVHVTLRSKTMNLKAAGISGDDRDLGLRVGRLSLESPPE